MALKAAGRVCWPRPDDVAQGDVGDHIRDRGVLLHARNNCEAFRMAGFGRADVLRAIATPVVN